MDPPDHTSSPKWPAEIQQLIDRLAVVVLCLALASQGVVEQSLVAVVIAAWLAFAAIKRDSNNPTESPLQRLVRRLARYLRYSDGQPIQFEIKHILYCFAVLGASLGLAGAPAGIFLAVFVLWLWTTVFKAIRRFPGGWWRQHDRYGQGCESVLNLSRGFLRLRERSSWAGKAAARSA